MAVYSSPVGNGYTLSVTVTVTSQSSANNTSTVSWVLELEKGHTFFNSRVEASVTMAGTLEWSRSGASGALNSAPSRSKMTIASGSKVYSHATDGTKSISVAASMKTVLQGYSWSMPPLSLSGTFVLPTIARLPNAPGAPVITEATGTRMLDVISPAAVANGSPITGYQIQETHYHPDTGWSGWSINNVGLGSRRLSFVPPKPLGIYVFAGRAVSAAGPGPWSANSRDVYASGSGPNVKVAGGVYKATQAYVRYLGAHRLTIGYVKIAGVWTEISK